MEFTSYDASRIPEYGDVGAWRNSGNCCAPDIQDGDYILTSKAALADLGAGGYVVAMHPTGQMLCKRVEGYDGVYWSLTNNYGHRFGCMGDLVTGAVVGVVRDGETIPVSMG